MTPEEKATELFKQYYSYLKANLMNDEEAWADAKECALMAIDEVEWFHKRLFYLTDGSLFDQYLKNVKQEIEKL
jgi:hypothetical protein